MLAGVMDRDKGKFGFIKQDSGEEDMFVMPKQCEAFGNMLPAIGVRVVYGVSTDEKTGKPRAEDVQPEDGQEVHHGTFDRHKGKFGFIKQDSGEDDMFLMPTQCVGFGGAFPPLGVRVLYNVAPDPKTGLPRAENVYPEPGGFKLATVAQLQVPDRVPARVPYFSTKAPARERPGVRVDRSIFHGTMARHKAGFGFIKQDSGEEDMFVMPHQCDAFGGVLPELGSRVTYGIVLDTKTGKPRADNVCPESAGLQPHQVGQMDQMDGNTRHSGTMSRVKNGFGFIQQDSGEDDMFVMPRQCEAFGGAFPALGSRVTYDIVADVKTGMPRAHDVQPEMKLEKPARNGGKRNNHARVSGAMIRAKGNFGFIELDTGEEMFVLPSNCGAFGGALPEVGERVTLTVVIDDKNGRPRAEDVQPDNSSPGKKQKLGTLDDEEKAEEIARVAFIGDARVSGTMIRGKGKFGFIELDTGEEMFVLPSNCAGFGGALPAVGERVTLTVVIDEKNGRPRAEDVQPDDSDPGKKQKLGTLDDQNNTQEEIAQEDVTFDLALDHTGIFDREKGAFGFIKQDSGDADMFVMPMQCAAFGGAFPPIGSPVVYVIATDPKTGKPRAENVRPASDDPSENALAGDDGLLD